jgi:Rrf2 family nitric oxide-sensitive transcriptional repressor
LQLTQKTDYAIRTLVFLALHRTRRVPAREVSEAFGISYHHVVKAIQILVSEGWVDSKNGKGGGLELKREPETLSLGEVVRVTENHFNMLECFDPETNTCCLFKVCAIKGAIKKAQLAFLKTLDNITLAQVSANKDQLSSALSQL